MNAAEGFERVAKRMVRIASPAIRALARRYAMNPRNTPKTLLRMMALGQIRVYVPAKLLSDFDILVDPFDVVGGQIKRNGCFEPETVRLIRKMLLPGMTFVDVGANIGQYSVLGGSLVGRNGAVLALEPDPPTCRLLRRNLNLNHLDNVKVFQLALSDVQGCADLFKGQYCNTGANSLRKTANTTSDTIKIRTDTMDNLTTSLARLDVIKLDVEGAEYLVLKGAIKTLENFRPAIILEVSDSSLTGNFAHTSGDALALLREFDYEIFRITDSDLIPYKPAGSDPSWFNVICISRNGRKKWLDQFT